MLRFQSACTPIRLSHFPLRATTPPESDGRSANRYRVTIQKPLGIVLEQATDTNAIYVESLTTDGAAAKTGLIRPGDQLISTSGVIYTSSRRYGPAEVKGGLQVVQMNVINESFDAVMAAIGSHPGHIPVELEFETVANASDK